MSVLDAALVNSPPDIQLSSPPDVSAEFDNPYSSSSSYMAQSSRPPFQLSLPPSKATRNSSLINSYITSDGDADINDGAHSYTSSPGRRGVRQYPVVHQNLVLPHSGYTTTPKAMAIGINQSADPTPSRRYGHIYSSPANESPLHASMMTAGEDTIAGQWQLNDDGGTMGGTTPTQSPARRAGAKRTLSGLGESPMRSGKRSRFASMGGSASTSVPPSPSRSGSLPSTHQERSASLAAPPFSTTSRQVSGMSMVSSASTELISPALMPYEGGYDGLSGFPTSMSAPEMSDLSAVASFEGIHSPTVGFHTVSPHELLPSSTGYQTVPNSVYPSPVVEHAMAPPAHSNRASPSLANAHPPFYSSQGMTLDTIHESEQPEMIPIGMADSGTPSVGPSGPPSTGAPAHRILGDGRGQYPMSAYDQAPELHHPYQISGPYQPIPGPSQSDHHQTPHQPTSTPPLFWSGGLGGSQPHQHGHRSPQGYIPSMYYTGPAPPPHHYPPPPPPHSYLQRAVSASDAYGYGPSNPYSPYQQIPLRSPTTFPHPSLTRSVSTPFVPSMPSMAHLPSGESTPGLYGPASARMSSSASLPNAAESSIHEPWASGAGSGSVGLGFGGGDQPQQYSWDSNPQKNTSTQSTPTTPSRKRYPSIGKRLRPGPKPRGTPKKRGASSSSAAGDDDADMKMSALPSPELENALPPSQYYVPRSRFITDAGAAARSSDPKAALELGGLLGQSSDPHSAGPSHEYHPHPHPSQQQHYPAQPLHAHIQPFAGSSYAAPQLHLAPAPRPPSPEGGAPGVPTDIIEGMYLTFMSTEGSATGQPTKRFRCLIETCEREFPRKSAIKSHIQTHLDDKPFNCQVGDCSASFVRHHDLKRHMKIHTGQKPFPCPCGKIFARGDALRRHRERKLTTSCLTPEAEEY